MHSDNIKKYQEGWYRNIYFFSFELFQGPYFIENLLPFFVIIKIIQEAETIPPKIRAETFSVHVTNILTGEKKIYSSIKGSVRPEPIGIGGGSKNPVRNRVREGSYKHYTFFVVHEKQPKYVTDRVLKKLIQGFFHW